MPINFPKLRAHIHPSYSYLLTKFHEQNTPGFGAEAISLKEMMDKVRETATTIYTSGLPFDLDWTLNNVNYILQRFIDISSGKRTMEPGDVYVFADALDSRFEKLLGIIERVDEQP